MGTSILMGMVLGLSAGLSPGPLLALLLAETLRHGSRAGIKVALAPLITDLPIILVALVVLARIRTADPVMAVISVGGGLFLFFLAGDTIRARPVEVAPDKKTPQRSLSKGILANLLNPHPYLFWLTVGVPAMHKAQVAHPAAPALFLASFYLCLVGSKALLAIGLGRSRSVFAGGVYRLSMLVLGLLLGLLALVFLVDGLGYFLNR